MLNSKLSISDDFKIVTVIIYFLILFYFPQKFCQLSRNRVVKEIRIAKGIINEKRERIFKNKLMSLMKNDLWITYCTIGRMKRKGIKIILVEEFYDHFEKKIFGIPHFALIYIFFFFSVCPMWWRGPLY